MKFLLPFFIAGLTFTACNTQPTAEQAALPVTDSIQQDSSSNQTISGNFSGIYEKGAFRSCEDPTKIYQIAGKKTDLDLAIKQFFPDSNNTTGIVVSVRGQLNGTTLQVDSLNSTTQKSSQTTCIPYKYWCMGNEPFWQLQISELENLIELYLPMEQKFIRFPYAAGTEDGNKTVYKLKDEKNKLNIVIQKAPCSDGMSEKQYSFKSEVMLNGRLLQGCAVQGAIMSK